MLFCDYNVTGLYFIDYLLTLVMLIITTININKIINFIRNQKGVFYYSLLLFIILVIISFLRSNGGGSMNDNIRKALLFISFILATISFFVDYKPRRFFLFNKSNDSFFFFLLILPIAYLVLNLLFKFLSIDIFNFLKDSSNSIGRSESIYYFTGVEINRSSFPLSNGINNFGSFSGATCVLLLSFFITTKKKKYKIIALSLSILSLIALLLLDTRSAMLAIIAILLGTYFLNEFTYLKIAKYIIIIIPLLPVILVVSNFFLHFLYNFTFLMRSDEESGTGNGRDSIWIYCLMELMDFKFIHLFGFGEFGHVGSKISNLWSDGFTNYADSKYITTHNLLLQLIFDIGYVGALVYYTLIISASNCIFEMYQVTKNKNVLIFQNFILFFSFVGGSEAINVHKSTFLLMFFFFICLIYYKKRILTSKLIKNQS